MGDFMGMRLGCTGFWWVATLAGMGRAVPCTGLGNPDFILEATRIAGIFLCFYIQADAGTKLSGCNQRLGAATQTDLTAGAMWWKVCPQTQIHTALGSSTAHRGLAKPSNNMIFPWQSAKSFPDISIFNVFLVQWSSYPMYDLRSGLRLPPAPSSTVRSRSI